MRGFNHLSPRTWKSRPAKILDKLKYFIAESAAAKWILISASIPKPTQLNRANDLTSVEIRVSLFLNIPFGCVKSSGLARSLMQLLHAKWLFLELYESDQTKNIFFSSFPCLLRNLFSVCAWHLTHLTSVLFFAAAAYLPLLQIRHYLRSKGAR